jgi:F0F1-type ATP synthase membrane subunit b/b'
MKRREVLLLERMSRAEAAAVQELRHQAADIAAEAVEKLLADALPKRGTKLVDEAIEELPKRVNEPV